MIRTPAGAKESELETELTSPTDYGKAGPSKHAQRSIENIKQTIAQMGKLTGLAPSTKASLSIPPGKRNLQLTTSKEVKQVSTGTATVTKVKINPSTPSPIKTRMSFSNKVEEAAEIHRKGLENLNRFQKLRKDIKMQLREALDRLYELAVAAPVAPVARKLDDELERESRKVEKMTQTNTSGIVREKEGHANQENGENRILTRIEENARLLIENGRKMEELKGIIEAQKEILETATYAGVAAGSQSRAENQKQLSLHSVIVSSKNKGETGEEVLERVRRAVDAKDGWVKVERVRKAKDRKIIMGCRTEQERKKVKDKLEAAGDDLVVEEITNRNPLLILRDVLKVHDDAEVIRALKNQNKEIFGGLDGVDGSLEIKYRRNARNPHNCHIILSVSPTIWRRAIDEKKIRIDLQRVTVEDQSPLVQCTRCLGYGHSKRFCKESADLCSHCGGLHLRVECPDRLVGTVPVCKNCTRAEIQHSGHNAFSSECPVRKKWDALARASVAYC